MKTLASLIAVSLFSATSLAGTITTTSTGTNPFNFVGSATTSATGVTLTPNAPLQSGAAWFRDKQAVKNGFNLSYDYVVDLSSASSLATGEGLAFVIQNAAATPIGGPAMGVGVTGLRDAVTVVLRTGTTRLLEIRKSGPNGISFAEPALASRAVTNDEIRQLFGNAALQGGARIGISYTPGVMNVSLNGRNVLSAAVDLTNVNGRSIVDSNGAAYVGWTAATSQFRADQQSIGNFAFTFIPTPGAVALMGLGGLAAARRRR